MTSEKKEPLDCDQGCANRKLEAEKVSKEQSWRQKRLVSNRKLEAEKNSKYRKIFWEHLEI